MPAQDITFESTVPGGTPAAPLAQYLHSRFAYRKTEQWEVEIKAGRIRINGDLAENSLQIKPGDQIAWTTSVNEPAVNDRIETLYEDEALLVVNKPAPLPCHAKAPYFRNTLIALLRKRLQNPQLRLAHRLDAGTSGVLVLTKSGETLRSVMRQFEKRQIQKKYFALCQGNPHWTQTKVDAAMALFEREGLKRWEISPDGHGKESRTDFKVTHRRSQHCLIEAKPSTGRTHQIRAHLFYLGHSILGDPLFNPDEEKVRLHRLWLRSDGAQGRREHFGSHRLLLHASQLSLTHPHSKETLTFKAPLPNDFNASEVSPA